MYQPLLSTSELRTIGNGLNKSFLFYCAMIVFICAVFVTLILALIPAYLSSAKTGEIDLEGRSTNISVFYNLTSVKLARASLESLQSIDESSWPIVKQKLQDLIRSRVVGVLVRAIFNVRTIDANSGQPSPWCRPNGCLQIDAQILAPIGCGSNCQTKKISQLNTSNTIDPVMKIQVKSVSNRTLNLTVNAFFITLLKGTVDQSETMASTSVTEYPITENPTVITTPPMSTLNTTKAVFRAAYPVIVTSNGKLISINNPITDPDALNDLTEIIKSIINSSLIISVSISNASFDIIAGNALAGATYQYNGTFHMIVTYIYSIGCKECFDLCNASLYSTSKVSTPLELSTIVITNIFPPTSVVAETPTLTTPTTTIITTSLQTNTQITSGSVPITTARSITTNKLGEITSVGYTSPTISGVSP